MIAGQIFRLTLMTMAAFASGAGAQPVGNMSSGTAEPTLGSDGSFIITPSNPQGAADDTAFEMNDPIVEFGTDHAERMMMPVKIGALGPYPFIIDTGSQRTIIATELAERLAMPALTPVQVISLEGRVTLPAVQLRALNFGGYQIDSLAALTVKRSNMGSLGVIGLDSLVDKRLILDFAKGRMEIGASQRASAKDGSDGSIIVRARSRFGQLILVNSRLDGRRVNVVLDTGAELSVGNMALFRSLKTKRLLVPPTPTSLVTITGAEVPALFTVVRRLTIGAASLDNVPMVFLDAAPFDQLGLSDEPAMLLGMGMLRLFDRVAIDFGHRHIDFHLAPAGAEQSRMRIAERSAADGLGR